MTYTVHDLEVMGLNKVGSNFGCVVLAKSEFKRNSIGDIVEIGAHALYYSVSNVSATTTAALLYSTCRRYQQITFPSWFLEQQITGANVYYLTYTYRHTDE